MYQLKGGEEVRDGKLYGWTGRQHKVCGGSGLNNNNFRCNSCGGTGDEWGLMPVQPADLPPDTEN